jgi:hypothetical protein
MPGNESTGAAEAVAHPEDTSSRDMFYAVLYATFCSFPATPNHDPCQPIAAFHALTIDRMERNLALRTVHCDINVTATARTRAGEILSHVAPPTCVVPPGIKPKLRMLYRQSIASDLACTSLVLRFCTPDKQPSTGAGRLSPTDSDCKWGPARLAV